MDEQKADRYLDDLIRTNQEKELKYTLFTPERYSYGCIWFYLVRERNRRDDNNELLERATYCGSRMALSEAVRAVREEARGSLYREILVSWANGVEKELSK
jgi:hypothetical protein